MTRPTSTEAWFEGGPADGAIRSVECGMDMRPPELLMFCGGEVFVGASDVPAPAARPAYELDAAPGDAGYWLYRHVSLLIESGPVVNAVTCGDQIEWDSIMSPVSLNLVRQCGFPGAVTLNLAGERGIVLTVV